MWFLQIPHFFSWVRPGDDMGGDNLVVNWVVWVLGHDCTCCGNAKFLLCTHIEVFFLSLWNTFSMCDKIICYFSRSPGKAPLLVPSLLLPCWWGGWSRERWNSTACEMFVRETMWVSQTTWTSLWRSGPDMLQLKRPARAASGGACFFELYKNQF